MTTNSSTSKKTLYNSMKPSCFPAQEAFDFMKWYCTTGAAGDYARGDLEEPFLDLHDENALEDFGGCAARCVDLSLLAAMTHLKVRLLRDVQMLDRNVRKYSGPNNPGYEKKMEWVREDAMSDVLYSRKDILDRSDYADLVADLQNQVRGLYERMRKVNKHYWPALKQPERYAGRSPTMYSPGSPEEVIGAFRHTWYLWSESPAVLDFVKNYT
ncbi:Uu.00g098800.m01.CDS01 [Anthostomella pinea]|uniref:Uu.00g098800.m01.CDS01 n=1 Tax=Anthostomella pinea TaxID=933095 RepID=A0AAI8YF27_9PEZI|nr:Uu.00g098800.m01.CDS01 [Anthostomella pinea]